MLKWIKLVLFVLFFVVAVFFGVTFAMQNDASSSLVLFNYALPTLTVGIWVSIALLIGVLLGFIVSIFPLFFARGLGANKDKKIARLESELSKLRMSAVKG